MLKPSEQVNMAIISLDGNANFEDIKKWLTDSFKRESSELILDENSPDHQHRIKQGMSKQLYQLTNFILKARENLDESRGLSKQAKQEKRGMESF